jgi:hypothetical protein
LDLTAVGLPDGYDKTRRRRGANVEIRRSGDIEQAYFRNTGPI